jgi:hypothetical protein
MINLAPTVANVARAAAQKIYGRRADGKTVGTPTVVFHSQAEAELLIKETIHVELRKLGLLK